MFYESNTEKTMRGRKVVVTSSLKKTNDMFSVAAGKAEKVDPGLVRILRY